MDYTVQRQEEAFYNYLIRGMDSKMRPTLHQMYIMLRLSKEQAHQREMKEMERRITENVLQQISVTIDDVAIKQLSAEIKKLGAN